ncbi:hypothetical protein SAMN05421736_10429 [Evansella caseinilytica]|uniref:ABC transporter periplasmic binding protein yphF n=1 Tax=Evansella caseinilytica TaxID=1503961 RepID=A0A1H3NCI9_9BACI|nr:hypothetical protein [Evansella caseinilytica]SDY86671.1 hypothetical protein SAMN05421736_10429 [Evansella caseinilytica]
MRSFWTGILLLTISLLVTGCLYPDERRVENQVPYPDQLQAVENAVIQYRIDNGALPVKITEEDTLIFQKYPVDFGKLVPKYLQQAPGNSFENGGTYQYVLIDVEEMPEVKLIDLTIMKEIQELQRRILSYRREHDYAPVAEVVGDELLKLDYELLNYEEEPSIKSPFHPTHHLPLLMQPDGEIIIDYSLDIQYYLEEYDNDIATGDDLRWLLVEHSPFVPVHSRPQTIEGEAIIFLPHESYE